MKMKLNAEAKKKEAKRMAVYAAMVEAMDFHIGRLIDFRTVKSDQILDSLNEEVAAILLTEVNYKTGQILDMSKITKKAHEKGILVIWDLSHSAGSIPVHLNKYSVDFGSRCNDARIWKSA